ncbi:MAG TPA: sulfotransferase [Acidobacteriaceae bacterium]|nr:sulfotransferase [Acidobacteriaceae bacterium]
MPSAAGPDFICIGMQKAGTGWLFDQLQFHPDFWTTPIKELRYLSGPYTKPLAEKFLRIARNPKRLKKVFASRRPLEPRDIAFLELVASYGDLPMDIDRYIAMFAFKGEQLTGDITPGYGLMQEDRIAEVGRRLPDTRILLILRDPISRVWSQISMAHRNGNFDAGLLEDLSGLRRYLRESEAIQRFAYASRMVERWRAQAPALAFRHFFFDDLAERPDQTRAEMIAYIGGDPAKPSGDLAAGHNRKAREEKLPLSEPVKGVLVEHFAEELRVCAKLFGGHAEAWAARYGV